jgi:hypothetical protein
MAANAYLAATAPPIAKWELMYDGMLKEDKISFVPRASVAEYALRFAQEVF